MSKIAYSFKAFLKRVRMSPDSLFLIVEGRRLDRNFYDRLLASSPELVRLGFQIHLAEQIQDVRGVAAGGKPAVLHLYDDAKRQGRLVQSNRRGPSVLAFAVDRDHDFIVGGTRRSPHILYTAHADVEADIFARGDDTKALALALSLDSSMARRVAGSVAGWRSELARTWRTWIELCCIAASLGAHCSLRISQPSWLNVDKYGAVDPAKLTAAEAQISTRSTFAGDEARRRHIISARIARYYARNAEDSLVKGKLMPDYLHHRVKESLSTRDIVDADDFDRIIAKAYLASIDFSAGWALAYHQKLIDLVPAEERRRRRSSTGSRASAISGSEPLESLIKASLDAKRQGI